MKKFLRNLYCIVIIASRNLIKLRMHLQALTFQNFQQNIYCSDDSFQTPLESPCAEQKHYFDVDHAEDQPLVMVLTPPDASESVLIEGWVHLPIIASLIFYCIFFFKINKTILWDDFR